MARVASVLERFVQIRTHPLSSVAALSLASSLARVMAPTTLGTAPPLRRIPLSGPPPSEAARSRASSSKKSS